MAFHGFTGVYPEEQAQGQRFEVDLDLCLDLARAASDDDLSATIDYGQVFRRVGQVVETGRFQLIEALAGAIAQAVFAGFPVDELTVRVRKPAAPLPGDFETVEVELHRHRANV
jgi:dihydroneopterin aldolase